MFCIFYERLYEIVDDPSLDSIISWSKSNKSFVIWNVDELIHKNILSRFDCKKLPEFISELEKYGFVRIKGSGNWEFGHREHFVRGQPDLMNKMHTKMAMKRIKNRFKAKKAREARQQVEDRLQNLRI